MHDMIVAHVDMSQLFPQQFYLFYKTQEDEVVAVPVNDHHFTPNDHHFTPYTEDEPEESDQDHDDFDEYGPLVVDTSDQLDNEVPVQQNNKDTSSLLSTKIEDIVTITNNSLTEINLNTASFLDGSGSNSSWTPSSSAQLSPSSISASISAAKTHRRGKKILPLNGDGEEAIYQCPICQEVVQSLHDLTIHIRTHNTHAAASQSNTCTICGKVLSSQSSLDRHMLVHSGERPFKCKVCKMSFTTNGNMHRHMRIHSKETDIEALGTKIRKKTPTFKPKAMFFSPIDFDGTSLNMSTPIPSREFSPKGLNFGEPTTPSSYMSPKGLKRTFNFVDCSPNWSLPKRQLLEERFNSALPPQSISSFIPLVVPQESPKIPSELAAEVKGEPEPQRVPVAVRQPTEEERDQLHCPVCNKTFLCKYGYQSHLETHPELSQNCQQCNLSFQSTRELDLHKLVAHSKSKDDDEKSIKSPLSEAVVGFHDLGFMDFSVTKFPLVAKSWCEENVRQSSSDYHKYICKECTKAFPCKSALLMHIHTHNPEKTAQCPLCECDFIDNKELHVHMAKHMADKAFDEVMDSDDIDEEDTDGHGTPEMVGKHDFLASFGLIAEKNPTEEKIKKEKPMSETILNMEKNENNDYFAKLGQVFSPFISPIHPMGKKNGEEIKSMAELQKLIQSSSNGMMPPFPAIPGMEHLQGINLNQFSAFLPSMIPYSLASQMTPTLAAMMSASQMMNAALSSQNMSSPLPTPPPSSESGSGSSGEMNNKGVFPCKYCDMLFPNYRALKGHTRTHLGLSPYKCNLCSYSSADKSTLIRHLRTHNGERPFQCRVCDFAFTTKANCERHVRKKHGKFMKDDVEQAIGYNKYALEDANSSTSFHSPDTVCKYCNIDFKFFRALKHHLRSHSSCRQKPFICTRCDVGFSTKANCIRHLQKQHVEISNNQIEQYITVKEPFNIDDSDKSFGDSDDGMPPEINERSTPSSIISGKSHAPPAAHTTPVLSVGTPASSRPATPVHIKSEPLDEDDIMPLDFSVRSGSNTPVGTPKKDQPTGRGTDQPMDLSVKKSPSPSPAPILKANLLQQTRVMYENSVHQCQFCPMGFSNPRALERHLWQNHPQLTSLLDPSYLKSLSGINPTVTEKLKQTVNLRLPVQPPSENLDDNETSSRSSKLMDKINNLQAMRMENQIKTEPRSSISGDSSDLASVNRILESANSHHFQSFLLRESGSITNEIMRNRLNLLRSVNPDRSREERPLEPRPDSNESASRPRPEDPSDSRDGQEMPTMMDIGDLPKQLEHFARLEKQRALQHQFNIPTTVDKKMDDKSAIKKKRNSYADSPHKLQCPYCTRTFPWVSSLTRHLLTHTGQKPFKCPRCPVTFSTKSNRERHLIRKHGVNMLDPLSRQTMDRPYKCHLCVFSSFSTQGNLLKHYKERHPNSSLPEGLAELDRVVTIGMSKTIPPEERGLGSNGSFYDSNDSSYLAEEQMNKSMDREVLEDRLMSSGRSEPDEDDLEIDESPEVPQRTEDVRPFSGTGEKQLNPERDNYNVDKITECWKCCEKFVSRKLLVRHLKEHNIDLPFKCYLCDASYFSRKECLFHQERNHTSDWLILKDKNKVDDIGDFSKHMDKVVENNLNKVDQDVVLEIPGQNADDPKMEVVSADYMQRKVYCSLCPKRFWSLQDLRRHMRSHTGERPFECDICQKRFTLKHSMMRHRKKHADSGSLSPSDDEAENNNEEQSAHKAANRPILPRLPMAIPALSMPVMPSISLGTSLNGGESVGVITDESRGHYTLPSVITSKSTTPSATISTPSLASLGKDSTADMLHNLLGVDVSSIDKMLDSVDSATQLLGM
ncbi:ras-responsive element-binding protein 1-like isoform X3 [Mytilus galloprovincialis]|uniref:ras-responsive element-binding protein 1-like isoform X3 n=1 Tax=Mytilus galloprovincialis TaxID=29158 RepID=UPI003F7BF65F